MAKKGRAIMISIVVGVVIFTAITFAAFNIWRRLAKEESPSKQTVKESPGDWEAHFKLGLGHLEKKDPDSVWKAINSFQKVTQIKPNHAPAYLSMGVAYRYIRHFDQAIQYCKKAIELNPNFPEAHFNLSITYLEKGDINSAWEKHKALEEFDAGLANELAGLLEEKSNKQ